MIHYVFYSNTDTDGEVELPDDIAEYGIVTSSSVKSAVGSQIWFVSGTGSPKQFRLCYTFIADGFAPRDDGERGHRIFGVTGGQLDPRPLLNQLPWFAELRKTQFWSLGLFPLPSDQIRDGFLELAPEMHTLSEEDEYLPECEDVDAQLGLEVADSLKLHPAERASRLASAPKIPEVFVVVSTAYRRNPDVIAETLIRANGCCAKCGNPAPFIRRSDGTPYLEVHHWIPLSEGGEDTVDNAGALCPNCHREMHHA